MVSYNQNDLEKNRNGTTPTWLKKVKTPHSLPKRDGESEKIAPSSGRCYVRVSRPSS